MNISEQNGRRVQNMAICFVENTDGVDYGKLCKLFFGADKLAIERTAFPISDLPYYAAPTGPMPLSIEKDKGIIPTFSLTDVITENEDGIFSLVEGVTFHRADFTDAELGIMFETCETFRDASATVMSELSHAEGEPWQVFLSTGHHIGERMPLEELVEWNLPPREQEERRRFRADARTSEDVFRSLLETEVR